MKIIFIETVWTPGRGKLPFFQRLLLSSLSIYPTLQARTYASSTPGECEIKFVNERFDRIDFDEEYDLVHINFVTPTALRAYAIADEFKRRGRTVVLSGLHPSALPEEAIQHADSVLIGRDEKRWIELVKDMEKGRIKRFYYARKKIDPKEIPKISVTSKQPLTFVGAIEATRGCRYRCTFCQDAYVCGAFVKRNVEDVVEEIKGMNHKIIMFYDLSLTIDPDYTKCLFKELKDLNKRFSCCGNIDVLGKDEELLRLSSEAGCVSWLIGFETFCQEELNRFGKKNKVEKYREAVKRIHDHGMAVIGSFMFGFDSDTRETLKTALDNISSLDVDGADFSILTPYPGTPLFKQMEIENRILTRDWSLYDRKHVVFKPKNISPEDLLEGVAWISENFYSPTNSIEMILRSTRYGFYPLLLTLVRNPIGRKTSPNIKSPRSLHL